MKATGIVRRVDDLGRVVIPKDIRRSLKIKEGEPLEIYVDPINHEVMFKKYQHNELQPIAQCIASSLAAENINVGVYDADGGRIAGRGKLEIDIDNALEDKDFVFPIAEYQVYGSYFGFVVVNGAVPNVEQRCRIESCVKMASHYFGQ